MQFTVNDGVWVRLVDVGAALSARSYAGDGEIVLEVTDAFLPENAGRWRVTSAAPSGHADPDLRLDVTGLGSVYLGGFGFRRPRPRVARRGAHAGRGRARRRALPHGGRALVRGDLLTAHG